MNLYICESQGFGHISVDEIEAENLEDAIKKARALHSIKVTATLKTKALMHMPKLDLDDADKWHSFHADE